MKSKQMQNTNLEISLYRLVKSSCSEISKRNKKKKLAISQQINDNIV